MSASKLTRNSSSLTRSPTLKSGIDSLVCLEEGLSSSSIPDDSLSKEHPHSQPSAGNPNNFHHKVLLHHHHPEDQQPPHLHQYHGRANHGSAFQLRLLLPPIVIVIFPCVYFYSKIMPRQHNHHVSRLILPSDADSSDYIALVFFFSAVLLSVRIAYPRVNFTYRFRTVFSRSRGCVVFSCLKPVTDFIVASKHDKAMFGRNPSSVIWTIGSKIRSVKPNKMTEGVQVYGNGDVYEGEFHQGKYCGSGVYSYFMSGRYEGDWIDGKYDGYGVETWARGSRYSGQYRQGLREGYGSYRFYTGDIYSGEWSHGQSHGRGVQTCVDGSRYVGEFKWGSKHGFGYYHFRNGDAYAGEYFADKMHGYGVYQFANGHRYEGAWHEGMRQGLGIYTFRNGEMQAGYWHAGTLQTPSTQNYEPGATMAVSHSKVLHVVQEARQAATKAHNLTRIDERVKKAVANANRAANAAKVAAAKAVQNKMSKESSSL